jgi:phosphatidylserine decarboxylase
MGGSGLRAQWGVGKVHLPRMKSQPVRFINRYTGAVETEPVPGEGWLRWLYESATGQLALHALVKRSLLSRWYGWRMDRPSSRARIAPFIAEYGIDMSQFSLPTSAYLTFNHFFHRSLAEDVRPSDPGANSIVFPADGRHFAFGNVDATDGFLVKGDKFSVAELLDDERVAEAFAGASMVISRLCPSDYHRFHFACGGVAGTTRLVRGPLFSVNPIALRRSVRYVAQNKRMITLLKNADVGTVAIVDIGATMVGSIVQTFATGAVRKGDEKGYFKFGGSCVITLFQQGRVKFADDVLRNTEAGLETYARMGDRLGISQGR